MVSEVQSNPTFMKVGIRSDKKRGMDLTFKDEPKSKKLSEDDFENCFLRLPSHNTLRLPSIGPDSYLFLLSPLKDDVNRKLPEMGANNFYDFACPESELY